MNQNKTAKKTSFVKVYVTDGVRAKVEQRAMELDLDVPDALRPLIHAFGRGELGMKPVWEKKPE